MRFLKQLWRDENGAVATEYVILTGLIAIALIGVLVAFRGKLATLIDSFKTKIQNVDAEAKP